jgi:hypothetical protein
MVEGAEKPGGPRWWPVPLVGFQRWGTVSWAWHVSGVAAELPATLGPSDVGHVSLPTLFLGVPVL